MHIHSPFELATWINVAANLAIVFGYFIVPFTVLRRMPLTPSVRASGSLFFLTCGTTHLAMAFGFEHTLFMVGVHVIQAVAVIGFVFGFHRLLRDAGRRRTGGGSSR